MIKKDTLHPKNIPTDDIYPTTSLDQIVDLKGVGKGSIQQPNYGVTGSDGVNITTPSEALGNSSVALNVRNKSKGDASIAGGYNSTANTKGDVAFNTSQAGLTEDEFNEKYPNGYWYSNDKMYLNYEQFKKRILNSAFSCNHGHSPASDSFSAGTHNNEHGSKAPNSATFGFWCITAYGTAKIYDSDGNLKYEYVADGSNSICGGKYSTCHNPSSLIYGDGLTAPKRNFPTAMFGRNNKNWHDDEGVDKYETILEIGNGVDQQHRSNAMVVVNDGRVKGFGKPKDKNDFVRLQELYERLPNPPNYDATDVGTYVLKAVVDNDFNIKIKWVKE